MPPPTSDAWERTTTLMSSQRSLPRTVSRCDGACFQGAADVLLRAGASAHLVTRASVRRSCHFPCACLPFPQRVCHKTLLWHGMYLQYSSRPCCAPVHRTAGAVHGGRGCAHRHMRRLHRGWRALTGGKPGCCQQLQGVVRVWARGIEKHGSQRSQCFSAVWKGPVARALGASMQGAAVM